MATKLTLTPTEVNITLKQGSDYPIEFQMQRTNATTGELEDIDITNETIKFTARDSFAGNIMIDTKSNGVGDHSTPLEGKTIFVITKDDTEVDGNEENEVTWVYEVRRVDANGLETVHVAGDLVLEPMVGDDSKVID